MGFPNVIYGDYGDEKVAQSTKIGSLPLGQLMILPDGRKFRHAQAGSAAAVSAGVIVAGSGTIANHGGVAGSGLEASLTTTFNAISATVIHLESNTVTAVSADYYADGYLNVQGPAASSYIGHVYRVVSNASAVSSAATAFTVTLEPSDGLKVAFAPTSTQVSLRRNPYKEMIAYSQGTIISGPGGVAPVAVSASFYFWCQRSGIASVKQAAAVAVLGEAIYCSTATAGSATESPDTADTSAIVAAYNLFIKQLPLGTALEAAAASQAVLVDLTLE